MTRGALSVAVERNGVMTPITRHTSGLKFTKTAQGGHAILQASLALPSGWELSPLDRVVVANAMTADILWDGYAEWPTPVDENGLRYFEIVALGGQSLLTDTVRPCYYCDSVEMMNNESWIRQPLTAPGATGEVSTPPTAADTTTAPASVVIQFPENVTLQPDKRTAMEYRLPREAGRSIYRLGLTREGGTSTSMIEQQVITWGTGGFTKNAHLSSDLSTTPATRNAWVGAGTMAAGQQIIRLQLQHTSVGVVNAGPNYWAAWYWMHVTALLGRKDGAPRAFADYPNPGNAPALRTDMIIEDLLSRHLGDQIDAANAVVEQGTTLIDQFTMMDGARDADVLDSLSLWEPDFLWTVGARQANGLHSFAYRKWPTEARYALPSKAQFDENGPDIDRCNRIAVKWRTQTGADRVTIVTTDVPELGTRIRDADPVSLPDGFGSPQNAEHIGAQVLAAENSAATTGTAVITGKIRDKTLGRDVWPWEIEPGYLLWLPRGEAVRINEVDYDDESCSAVLRVGMELPGRDQFTSRLERQGRDDYRRKWPARRKKKRWTKVVIGRKKKPTKKGGS